MVNSLVYMSASSGLVLVKVIELFLVPRGHSFDGAAGNC